MQNCNLKLISILKVAFTAVVRQRGLISDRMCSLNPATEYMAIGGKVKIKNDEKLTI